MILETVNSMQTNELCSRLKIMLPTKYSLTNLIYIDWGSIHGRVIPKTQKMVLDTTLLNTQHYKVRIKGKVEQSIEWSSTLPYTLG